MTHYAAKEQAINALQLRVGKTTKGELQEFCVGVRSLLNIGSTVTYPDTTDIRWVVLGDVEVYDTDYIIRWSDGAYDVIEEHLFERLFAPTLTPEGTKVYTNGELSNLMRGSHG